MPGARDKVVRNTKTTEGLNAAIMKQYESLDMQSQEAVGLGINYSPRAQAIHVKMNDLCAAHIQADLEYEAGLREVGIHQQVWVLEGCMEFIFDGQHHRLQAGDCLAMQENQRIVFQNTSKLPARYVVVVNTGFLTS